MMFVRSGQLSIISLMFHLLLYSVFISVETLGHECNSTGLCIHFNNARVASETRMVMLFLKFAKLFVKPILSVTIFPFSLLRI